MKNIKTFIKHLNERLIKDESGQGIAEYVLLLVVVVAVAVLFRSQIMTAVQTKVSAVGTEINSFGQ